MADIKLIPATCPSCGANLDLPESAQKAYCMYCGTEILVGRPEAAPKVQCKICEGFGRIDTCKACNGTGHCTWSTRSPGYRGNELLMLGFSSQCIDGTCSACKGSGRYMLGGCPGCGGTGQCPRCFGTGKCAACRGVGFFPNPNGLDVCSACGGTGVASLPSPTPPASKPLTRCPNCAKELDEDISVCPNCGYIKRVCPSCGAVWVAGAMFCRKCGFGKGSGQQEAQE